MSVLSFTRFSLSINLVIRSLGISLLLCLLMVEVPLAQTITTAAGDHGWGLGPDQLHEPTGIYIDGAGYLYIADRYNHRIQKFPPNSTAATAGTTVAGGNGEGSAANQLKYPVGVCVDGSGTIYVADALNNRVQKFPPNSTSATAGFTMAGGIEAGSEANQFLYPAGVCVDASGNLYVADLNNNRVQKFPPNSTSATAGITVAGGNIYGSAPNQFGGPAAVCLDRFGNLYVADRSNHRVQRFPPNSTSATAGFTVAGGNGFGKAANQLNQPTGLYIDELGNLYVADLANSRVQRFGRNSTSFSSGVTLAGGYGYGYGPNQLAYPYGVFVDKSGSLYLSDQNAGHVLKYRYPPVITSQPVASSLVCTGATITAQVSATATIPDPNFTYQWYSDSGPISGQTSPTLSLTNVQPSNAASYSAIITSSNGLRTTSTSFQLSVLARPTVSLVASGSLSPASPSVILTASGASTYEFSPGATQIGNGSTATVNTPGQYSVLGTGTNGCSNMASTMVTLTPSPDLSPLLYARPISLYVSSPVTVVVDVVELNGVASSGLITLRISQQAGLSLSLPPNETMVGGRLVTNSAWQLSGPSGGYYTLTTSQSVLAGDKLSVGLIGSYSGSSAGGLTVSATVTGGGESNLLNNTDADKVEFFQQ